MLRYLRKIVYVSKPEPGILVQLKEGINREISEVGSQSLECVMEHLFERATARQAENGCHLNYATFDM